MDGLECLEKNIKDFLRKKVQEKFFNKRKIQSKIQERIENYQTDLEQRQVKLKNLLDRESQQYQNEYLYLVQMGVKECFNYRLNWLKTNRLERQKADEDFIKLKQQQREFDSSEESRLMLSKNLTLNTKAAQLYQIEEKIYQKNQENRREMNWSSVMEKVRFEKCQQECYENKLRQMIACNNQLENQKMFMNKQENMGQRKS